GRGVPSAAPTALVKFEDSIITTQTAPSAPPFSSCGPHPHPLTRCSAVFLPGDPARTGRVAFWHPDGPPPQVLEHGRPEALAVSTPGPDGAGRRTVPALLVPVRPALPLLLRARTFGQGHRATVFWGAA